MKHLDYLKRAPTGARLSLQDTDSWPLQWFTPAELACRHCGSLNLDLRAAIKLDWLREKLGRPVTVASAYRCRAHNAAVGGATKSLHLTGQAFDLPFHQSGEMVDLIQAALHCGFNGFGFYRTFVHVDDGLRRSWIG